MRYHCRTRAGVGAESPRVHPARKRCGPPGIAKQISKYNVSVPYPILPLGGRLHNKAGAAAERNVATERFLLDVTR